MKRVLMILVLVASAMTYAQTLSKDFEVTKGTPYQVVDGSSKEFVALDGGFTISVKMDGELVTVQKYDVNAEKEVARSTYEDFPKYAKVQSLIKAGDKVFYVFEAYNKKAKTFTVYSREVNTATTKFNDSKELFTTLRPVVIPRDLSITGVGIQRTMVPKFDVSTSFDQSKILIRYRNKPLFKDDSKNYDELGFYVFDSNFEKQWGREVKMPHTEKEMNNLAYSVTNNGDVFMLSRLNETQAFEVITITESDLVNKKLEVKEGLLFDKFDLRETANGNILAVGYYANGIEFKMNWTGAGSLSKNINGLYTFEFKQDGELVKSNDYPFSTEIIKAYLKERNQKKVDAKEEKGTAGITDLRLKELVVNKDGSIVVIGEVDYVRNEMYGTSQQSVRHFGNMVITKIGADGKLIWEKKLPKNQATISTDVANVAGLSIAYAQGSGSHYILFVDNRKNANLTIDQPAVPHKGGLGGYLTAYKINDSSGEVEKHLILDLTNIDGQKAYQFRVSRILKALDQTFVLEVYIKKKQDMMVKMKIK